MDRVVLPTLGDLASDPDSDVRRHGAQLLVQFLSSTDAKWVTELLAIGSSLLQQGIYTATRAREDRVRLRKDFTSLCDDDINPSRVMRHRSSPTPRPWFLV